MPINTDRMRTVAPAPLFTVVRDSYSGHHKFSRLSQINIYTNGSAMNGGLGSAFVVDDGRQLYHSEAVPLPNESSVFQAELTAIRLAAEFVVSESVSLRPRHVKIFSAVSYTHLTLPTILRV